MSSKISIYIATHRPKSILSNAIFKPIQVGKSLQNFLIDPNYLTDNSGIEISTKNARFNELTALYWAWKNDTESSIIGLFHYRRLLHIFYKNKRFKKEVTPSIICIPIHHKNIKKLRNPLLARLKLWFSLLHYDVILPIPTQLLHDNFKSVAAQYQFHHQKSDWETCMHIVQTLYPEYQTSIEKYLENDSVLYIGNMFIANRTWVQQYCEWLFTILFEVEKQIPPKEDAYQNRVIGFLAERLFTLYILHHQFKVKEVPILMIQE